MAEATSVEARTLFAAISLAASNAAKLAFGKHFLEVAAGAVITPGCTSAYIEMVAQFCEGLLSIKDTPLPNIDHKAKSKILDQFSWLLEKTEDGRQLPPGFFYGQRLVEARIRERREAQVSENQRPKKDKIVYRGTPLVVRPDDDNDGTVLQLRPDATTPSKKRSEEHTSELQSH